MKKIYSFTLMLACVLGMKLNAQTINNPGFETWENLGAATEEPTEWNSFKTATGGLSSYASQQLIHSTVVRPGTSGSYSALIWSRSVLGIIANGNITTGRINMANIDPSNSSNYNTSLTSDPAFNEAFTSDPDSIVFWVKFVPASGSTSDSARMHAVIHDAYDYRDPSGSDPNGPSHVFSEAVCHFVKTNGLWVRKAVAFVPGPASAPAYLLLTFTTNKTPGGGSGADSLYIDDIGFVYNGLGVKEVSANSNLSLCNNNHGMLTAHFNFDSEKSASLRIYNMNGQLLQERHTSTLKNTETFDINNYASGIYILQVTCDDGSRLTGKFAVN